MILPDAYIETDERGQRFLRWKDDTENDFQPLYTAPIPMLLFCPKCDLQHVDAPNPAKDWTNQPHRSHECQMCGWTWRPADVATTGVRTLETAGQGDRTAHPWRAKTER